MVFNVTFNNISDISWLSVLLAEETVLPGENLRFAASHRQILSHKIRVCVAPSLVVCVVLCITVCLCVVLCITVCLCVVLCITVCFCVLLCITVCFCVLFILATALPAFLQYMASECHFQQYFRYIVALSFISGRNRITRRKPPICGKSPTNFIT
jgi:hypothetical protein